MLCNSEADGNKKTEWEKSLSGTLLHNEQLTNHAGLTRYTFEISILTGLK